MVGLSDEVVHEFVAEFGEGAPQVAEKALRSEITRRRIERAVKDGTDPAARPGELPADSARGQPGSLARRRAESQPPGGRDPSGTTAERPAADRT